MKLAREVSSITCEAAHEAVAVGVRKAQEKGWRMNLAVVDRGGTVEAMAAAEGLEFRAVLTAPDLGFPYEGG